MAKNNALVCGHIGRAETKFTAQGTAVMNIRLAATDSHYDKNEGKWVDHETVWYDVTLWGKDAEKATEMGVDKRDFLMVWGTIEMHNYTTKSGKEGTALRFARVESWGWQPKNAAIGASKEGEPSW